MKRLGLFDMLQIAAGLSMAGPMFVIGFEFLRTGRPAGGVGFLALGFVALYFPTYLIKRIGGPRAWIRRRLERRRSNGNAGGDDGTNAGDGPDGGDGADVDGSDRGVRPSLRGRLRRWRSK